MLDKNKIEIKKYIMKGKKILVVIPTSKPNYEISFSAPLSWLFGKNMHNVKGIFSFQLTPELVCSYDYFIVELNWFTELYEFGLIVDYIKSHNKKAKILFGGLHSQLKYKTIFDNYDVDYFIKGDNELPIQMFLNGDNIRDIPNFVSRSFENDIEYVFKKEDYDNLEFNLDWFPDYFRFLKKFDPNSDTRNFSNPMILSSKGCTIPHDGCDYCLGSKLHIYKSCYNRGPVTIDNDQLIKLIKKIEAKFDKLTLYIISPYNYDFSNIKFNIDATIEVDSEISLEQIKNLIFAFKKARVLLPIHKDGIMGKEIIDNYKDILDLQDENHEIHFAAYSYEADIIGKDAKNIFFNLDNVFASPYARYENYIKDDCALLVSKRVYEKTQFKFIKR